MKKGTVNEKNKKILKSWVFALIFSCCIAAAFYLLLMLFRTLNGTNGSVRPKFKEVAEDSIKEDAQIVSLNESASYYKMSIHKDTENIYYYSIGYDDSGTLSDKTVIQTLPTGAKKERDIIINATFPEASHPSYAVGFILSDGTEEYYILDNDGKGGVRSEYVKDRDTFFVKD